MDQKNLSSRKRPTSGIIRLIVGALCALLAFSAVPALGFFGKPATQHPVSVHVYDDAGILNDRHLVETISQIDFVKPVKISILTLPTLDGQSLNYKTLEYGRNAPLQEAWISPSNPRYWADQTLILALAPYERQVGTYFGEDIAVDLTTQAQIQEAMKDDLRASRYDEAFYRGAQATARYLDTSLANSVVGQVGAGLVSLLGLGWFVIRATNRARSRKNLREARRNYAQVSSDFEATSLDAGILDQTDIHGQKIYERYTQFVRDYHDLTRRFQDFGSLGFVESLFPAAVKETSELRDKAVALNAVDDGISNTAAFLTMSSRWPEVWRNETGPIYEDLDAFEQLIRDVEEIPEGLRSSSRADAQKVRQRLAHMAAELQAGSLTPSEALSELDQMSNTLWSRSRQILEESMQAARERGRDVGYDEVNTIFRRNRTGYSGQWREGRRVQTYHPGSTIRVNRGRSGGSDRSSSSRRSSTSALAGLVVGYSKSPINPSYVSSSSSGSDSSSHSDYGGGSNFSGSGSSSSY